MIAGTPRFGGTAVLMEMQEFATFSKGGQRFIRRSLDVGLGRRDAVTRWARDPGEAENIRAQQRAYRRLDGIRRRVPVEATIEPVARLMTPLVAVSAFDLGQGRLTSFAAYRFLYERLIGASVRPWLPSAFCAAAALPHLHPEQRRALLNTIGEAATARRWSSREPGFVPEWVEKVDATISA
jgi:hypothetical protein